MTFSKDGISSHIQFYVLNKRSGELVQMLWQAQAVLIGTANSVGMWRNQVMSAVVRTPALHKVIH